MTFLNGTTEISTNGDFKNIPIRRNYRTNVSGNLLTKQGTFNVTIDPEFYKPDINDYPELRAALANGGSVTPVGQYDGQGASGCGKRQDGRDRSEWAYDYERN